MDIQLYFIDSGYFSMIYDSLFTSNGRVGVASSSIYFYSRAFSLNNPPQARTAINLCVAEKEKPRNRL